MKYFLSTTQPYNNWGIYSPIYALGLTDFGNHRSLYFVNSYCYFYRLGNRVGLSTENCSCIEIIEVEYTLQADSLPSAPATHLRTTQKMCHLFLWYWNWDLKLSILQFQFFRKLFTGLFTVTYNCPIVITGVVPLRRGFLHAPWPVTFAELSMTPWPQWYHFHFPA